MNERLDLGSELDDFEASLVASGKREGMGSAKKRALALALAGGAAAATLGTAGAAKAAGSILPAATAATKAKGAASLAILKWIAAGTLGSAIAVGATTGAVHVYESKQLEVSARTAPQPAPSSVTPAAKLIAKPANVVAPAESAPVKEAAPSVTTSDLPVAPSAPTPAKPIAARPPKIDDTKSSIADELKTIERARAALAANDAAAAARALDEHDRNFPNGGFAEESRVLRIDLHARRGDAARAKSEAKAYLAAHPSSPYAPRLRVLAGEGGEP